jgi:hypothetical protein
MPRLTPHQRTEKKLSASGADDARNVGGARLAAGAGAVCPHEDVLRVRRQTGADGALAMIMKLPGPAALVQDLSFERESKGAFRQHDWLIARFVSEEDILAEMPTLKACMTQSSCAVAPKKFARLVWAEA